jgi:hypothetical protein
MKASCFLRTPRGWWRHGTISVDIDGIVWRPFWSLRRPRTVLARTTVAVLGVYEAIGDHGGANLKEYLFKVIECRFDGSDNVVEVAVPRKLVGAIRQDMMVFSGRHDRD